MLNMKKFNHQGGFSLLEALFAMVVLSIAMLSIARMHALVTQDGGFSKARAIAVNLAQEKLDDLRSFTSINTGCTAPVFCYSEITDSDASDVNVGGGRENDDGTLVFKSGDLPAVGNTTYNRSWDVTDYYRCGTAAPSTTNCASPFTKAYPDFKVVAVTVAWTDEQGTARSVVLNANIHSSSLTAEANALGHPYTGAGPLVSYTPVGVPDAVPVPINTGGTKFKESSKPLPEVSQSGTGIAVSFDSVIYKGVGTYTKDSQEEFTTVGCECQFQGGTNSGYTASRKIWNGKELEVKVGNWVQKPTGQTLGNNPPDNCDICCRDHHDANSNSYAKYDPQRPSEDYVSGDHKHYYYKECVSSGVGATNCTTNQKHDSLNSETPLLQVTSGAYLESCRIQRVDGIWRVMQDWKLRKVTVLPYPFLTTSTNLNNYINMVDQVVENAVKTDYTGTGITIGGLSGRDLVMSPGTTPMQLLSRAVYVDTIYYESDDAETVDNELTLPDTNYYTALLGKLTASRSATPANSAWLDYAPFYEANLTMLYDWTSDTPGIATVTSERISAIVNPESNYYGSYSRGKVTIQSGVTAGTATIKAKARLANSGVTGGVNRLTDLAYVPGVSFGTDPHDSANTIYDTIIVTRPASGTNHVIQGKVVKGNSSVNVAETGSPASPITVVASPTTGLVSQCAAQIGDSDTNAWYYSCTVASGWTGTLTFSSTGSVYTFNDASTTSLNVSIPAVGGVVNVDPIVAYGGNVNIKGKVIPFNVTGANSTGTPDVTASNATITFNGLVGATATNGTCTNKVLLGNGASERLEYICTVPKNWTGAITVTMSTVGGAYYYWSPPYDATSTPCNGIYPSYVTSASCTMATISSALADIDGTSASATLAQRQQTNVGAGR